MRHLTLEYVLDSRRPGYAFTTPTDSFDQAALKAIWQGAMPRGQGWRGYIGARALKCFPLEGGRRVALCEVTVTDQADESGRRGIRRAEITVIEAGDYLGALRQRLAALPEPTRQAAGRRLTCWRWKCILDRALPKVRRSRGQIVLAAPYTTPADWAVVEAVVLRVATSRRLRALKGWPRVVSITTLALDPREESRIVALPLEAAGQWPGAHAIDIS